jgi:hypothetical protein
VGSTRRHRAVVDGHTVYPAEAVFSAVGALHNKAKYSLVCGSLYLRKQASALDPARWSFLVSTEEGMRLFFH